jgi:hypothetical protein
MSTFICCSDIEDILWNIKVPNINNVFYNGNGKSKTLKLINNINVIIKKYESVKVFSLRENMGGISINPINIDFNFDVKQLLFFEGKRSTFTLSRVMMPCKWCGVPLLNPAYIINDLNFCNICHKNLIYVTFVKLNDKLLILNEICNTYDIVNDVKSHIIKNL